MDNLALSKPTWEIMKFIWEITDFISPIIFGAIFEVRTSRKVWKTKKEDIREDPLNYKAAFLSF